MRISDYISIIAAIDPLTYDPKVDAKIVVPMNLYKKLLGMNKVPMGFNIKIEIGLALLNKKVATWLKKSGYDKKIAKWIKDGEKSLVVVPEDTPQPGYEGRPWPDIFTEIHEIGHSVWFKLPPEFRTKLEAAYFSHYEPHMNKIYKKRGYAAHKRPGEFFADTYAFWKFPPAKMKKWLSKSKDDMIHTLNKLGAAKLHLEFRKKADKIEKEPAPPKQDASLPQVKPKKTTTAPAPTKAPSGGATANVWKKRLTKVIKNGLSMGKTPEEIADYLLQNVEFSRKNFSWEP
jgi:hypothetical protein